MKRIIVDFDDTLAYTENRDWANAKPNDALIKKLNQLQNIGWIVDIFTARGSLSCKTREEADAKYRSSIEQWLNDNHVKFNSLSFNKPLGVYYIDDKSITPDDFLKLDIVNLEGGLSGDDIYTDGNDVNKTQKNAAEVCSWYKIASSIVNVPQVKRIVGNTITMEYINHDKDFFKNNPYIAIGLIQDTLSKFKTVKLNKPEFSYESYLNRIKSHCDLADIDFFHEAYYEARNICIPNQTFSHGDFGITNLLFQNSKLFLIDPIPNMFGCTELDICKFIASLYINKFEDSLIDMVTKQLAAFANMHNYEIRILVATELIRVYKYHHDKPLIKSLIKQCF